VFDSVISSRTSQKSGCPYCSGKRASEDNNLNHLFPKIASEWHPTKNGELKPEEVTHGSDRSVWWLCPKGHEYDSIISGRTRKDRPRGCPYCSGRRIGKDNNLKFLFPNIADEWHPTKNGELKPDEVSYASHKKVWWLCPKGHEYDSII
jgi:DNA-directed RNA polymerase subunit RPC12/RpoP